MGSSSDNWRQHLESKRDQLTAVMEQVYEGHKGGPVPEVRDALRQALEQEVGLTELTDDWLTPYAEVISGGRRVVFEVG